jgi:hypothetical protein
MRGPNAFGVALAIIFLVSAPALAETGKRCGQSGGPWIRLHTEGMSADERETLLTHVRSSLVSRHIDLCVADDAVATEPLASSRRIVAAPPESARIEPVPTHLCT